MTDDLSITNDRQRGAVEISEVPKQPQDFLTEIGVSPEQAEERCQYLARRFLQQHGVHQDAIHTADASTARTALIVRTASHPWEVLDDATITDILAPFPVVRRVLFMPLGYPIGVARSSLENATSDVGSNVPELIRQLTDPAIGLLYLQIGPHVKSEVLLLLARYLRPDLRIFAEFYDMGALFARDYLTGTRLFTEDDVAITRLAAWAAAQSGGAVVQKADGPAMTTLFDAYDSEVFVWNPMHGSLQQAIRPDRRQTGTPISRQTKDTRSIAFAGSLSDVELARGASAAPSVNMIDTFATLMRDGRLSVSIFNAADRRDHGAPDARFQRVQDWWQTYGDRHVYRSAIPQDDLLSALQAYDFGFFCVHYADTPVQHVGRYAIPNRVMAYLAAGLPIIVDSEATTVAGWVSDYHAGVVVDPKDFEELPDQICAADLERLRAGVRNLREELVRRNLATLSELRALVTRWHRSSANPRPSP